MRSSVKRILKLIRIASYTSKRTASNTKASRSMPRPRKRFIISEVVGTDA
jgi:hypothetical protein